MAVQPGILFVVTSRSEWRNIHDYAKKIFDQIQHSRDPTIYVHHLIPAHLPSSMPLVYLSIILLFILSYKSFVCYYCWGCKKIVSNTTHMAQLYIVWGHSALCGVVETHHHQDDPVEE